MSVYKFVDVYGYMSICARAFKRASIYANVVTCLLIHINMYIMCVHVSIYICTCTYAHARMQGKEHVCMHVCMYVCMYIYIYICVITSLCTSTGGVRGEPTLAAVRGGLSMVKNPTNAKLSCHSESSAASIFYDVLQSWEVEILCDSCIHAESVLKSNVHGSLQAPQSNRTQGGSRNHPKSCHVAAREVAWIVKQC